ncbi:unnamed protein product [Heligmosomoides polygyrus]|uniref:Uncharacterized protein n=1 Tax=Heligmosomoides polygyrus TaxID=6339 RepID=A0A183G376_HELPZ|nr:unnamed protein product [Heligmosomoides polygyrus]
MSANEGYFLLPPALQQLPSFLVAPPSAAIPGTGTPPPPLGLNVVDSRATSSDEELDPSTRCAVRVLRRVSAFT